MRPLPDIDLARIAPKPDEKKLKSLEQIKVGRPPFSYKPVRSCFDDIFNIQPDLDFGATPTTSWRIVEALLRKRASGEEEFKHNKRVAKSLYEFAATHKIMGRKQDFFPMAMGVGRKVTLWLPMIIGIDEVPHAVFIEPRRSRGLTEEGRRFAFSMMHERIRAVDEDYANISLSILRFGDPDEGKRKVKHYTDDGVDLYSLDELQEMVSRTYDIWLEVLKGREQESRHKSTGTGPLI